VQALYTHFVWPIHCLHTFIVYTHSLMRSCNARNAAAAGAARVCVYVYIFTCICIYTYVCIYIYVNLCIYVYICIHIHIYSPRQAVRGWQHTWSATRHSTQRVQHTYIWRARLCGSTHRACDSLVVHTTLSGSTHRQFLTLCHWQHTQWQHTHRQCVTLWQHTLWQRTQWQHTQAACV